MVNSISKSYLRGKNVLITGASGMLGQEALGRRRGRWCIFNHDRRKFRWPNCPCANGWRKRSARCIFVMDVTSEASVMDVSKALTSGASLSTAYGAHQR